VVLTILNSTHGDRLVAPFRKSACLLARISRQLSSVQSDPSHTAKTIAENSKKNDDNKQEIVKYLQSQMDKPLNGETINIQ
jgi:hypothetical protein